VKFQIRRAQNGEYFWRIVGGNGETMSSSETYPSKESAKHAISVVKANAATARVEDLT
jgi:uncharacterized protein YegP (UPF0339 family)